MSNAIVNSAKNTHYAVSTFAAVVYALVWMLSGRAHAETQLAQVSIPEIVVTGHREVVQSDIPEIVVWGKREAATVVAMQEIVVWGNRETTTDAPRIAAATSNVYASGDTKSNGSWVSKARRWLQTAL